MKLSSRLLLGIHVYVAIKCFLVILNEIYGGPEFTSPLLNCIAMLLVYWAPILCLRIRLGELSTWQERFRDGLVWVFVCLSVIFGLWSILYIFWNGNVFFDGGSGGKEPMHRVRVRFGDVVLYRTNGGAMDGFGTIVQQEFSTAPGVIWAHILYRSGGYGDQVQLVRVGPTRVDCRFVYYERSGSGEHTKRHESTITVNTL